MGKRETLNTLDKDLFRYFHLQEHIEKRHFVDRDVLMARLAPLPMHADGEITSMSRFVQESMDDVIPLIRECIVNRFDTIEKWLSKDPRHGTKYELWFQFPQAIGEAMVKEAGYQVFPASVLSAIIVPANHAESDAGVLFRIISAYPKFSFSEEDTVLDVIDGLL